MDAHGLGGGLVEPRSLDGRKYWHHDGTWIYSGHVTAHWTGLGKLGSWYLLLYVAFVTVSVVSREALEAGSKAVKPAPAKKER